MNIEDLDLTIEDLTPVELSGSAVRITEGNHPFGRMPANIDMRLFAAALRCMFPNVEFNSWANHNLAVASTGQADVTAMIPWEIFTTANEAELVELVEDWGQRW